MSSKPLVTKELPSGERLPCIFVSLHFPASFGSCIGSLLYLVLFLSSLVGWYLHYSDFYTDRISTLLSLSLIWSFGINIANTVDIADIVDTVIFIGSLHYPPFMGGDLTHYSPIYGLMLIIHTAFVQLLVQLLVIAILSLRRWCLHLEP